jgi:hypothetical protein
MGESLSLTIRKNLLFLRVKLLNLRNLRVPPKKKLGQSNNLNPATPSLLLLPLLPSAKGRETKSKIPVPPSLLNQLPKNPLRRKRVPSTPSMMLALLARELLYFCFCLSFFFGILIFCLTVILIGLRKERRKKNPQPMARLLRARPISWFFLKNTAQLRKLRLPHNRTQKHRLLCPSPERLCRRKQDLGLVVPKRLSRGIV